VGDVGVAALALLPGVRGLGDVIGVLQQGEIGLGVALPVQGGERFEDRTDGAALAGDDAAGEAVADAAGATRPVRARAPDAAMPMASFLMCFPTFEMGPWALRSRTRARRVGDVR
jgi:hypothetical protein